MKTFLRFYQVLKHDSQPISAGILLAYFLKFQSSDFIVAYQSAH